MPRSTVVTGQANSELLSMPNVAVAHTLQFLSAQPYLSWDVGLHLALTKSASLLPRTALETESSAAITLAMRDTVGLDLARRASN